MIGRSLQRDFEAMINHKLIKNLPINADDAKHASVIFGLDLARIKGKMVQQRPEHLMQRKGLWHCLKVC